MIFLALSASAWCGLGLIAFILLCLIVVGGDVESERIKYREKISRMSEEERAKERRRIDTWGYD